MPKDKQQTPGDVDLVDLYVRSRDQYRRVYQNRGDWPCFFARDGAIIINTNDQDVTSLPMSRFFRCDYL